MPRSQPCWPEGPSRRRLPCAGGSSTSSCDSRSEEVQGLPVAHGWDRATHWRRSASCAGSAPLPWRSWGV
jgi:hypothetical protein